MDMKVKEGLTISERAQAVSTLVSAALGGVPFILLAQDAENEMMSLTTNVKRESIPEFMEDATNSIDGMIKVSPGWDGAADLQKDAEVQKDTVDEIEIPSYEEIIVAADILRRACYGAALKAGWWKTTDGHDVASNPYAFSNKLMLTVSELAEAMEGDRKSKMDDKLPNRPMREVECADAIIRLFDMSGGFNLDIPGAIADKLKFNSVREDHKMASRKGREGKAY